MTPARFHYISDDEDGNKEPHKRDPPAVSTLLYTLPNDDMAAVEQPNGWLNDKVIQAGQEIMAQQFPTIKGLQPTTLQEVRGFEVHREPFVQILNVSRNHWFVVSTVNCEPGHVRVYDTIHTDVLDCIIPIIASLLNCTMPSIIINMVDVANKETAPTVGYWHWPWPLTCVLVTILRQ